MNRVLLIGGMGFIGHHLAKALLERGIKVYTVDNLSNSPVLADQVANYSTEFFNLDITNAQEFEESFPAILCRNPDLTFLLAADHYIPFCEEHPLRTICTNVSSALSCAKELYSNIPGHRLVFFSSAAVFDGRPEHNYLFSEDDIPKPSSIYGVSKLSAENVLTWTAKKHGGTLKILRCTNVYGTGDQTNHLIPRIIQQICSTSLLSLGNTDPVRDFIHVSDIVIGALKAAQTPSKDNEIFHLGTGKPSSVMEVVDILLELSSTFGLTPKLTIQPELKRTNDVSSLVLDNQKARSHLGWSPKVNLKSGLKDLLTSSINKSIK